MKIEKNYFFRLTPIFFIASTFYIVSSTFPVQFSAKSTKISINSKNISIPNCYRYIFGDPSKPTAREFRIDPLPTHTRTHTFTHRPHQSPKPSNIIVYVIKRTQRTLVIFPTKTPKSAKIRKSSHFPRPVSSRNTPSNRICILCRKVAGC